MKMPFNAKEKKFNKKGERGSVTIFVLIAMLFFLIVGIMLFTSNMNTQTSQKRDVAKIQNEYGKTDLDQVYEKEKQKQAGKLLISVTNNKGEIYQNNTWLNATQASTLPLTVNVTWPDGVKESDKKLEITITNYSNNKDSSTIRIDIKENSILMNGSEVNIFDIGNINKITKDCDYKIKASANGETAEVQVKVDITAPIVNVQTEGDGIIWQLPGEAKTGRISSQIEATDGWQVNGQTNLDKVQYIVNQSEVRPDANADWQDYTGTIEKTISAGEGEYYIHARATDKAGNETYFDDSTPHAVKFANYEIVTEGQATNYAETLEEAIRKSSETKVSTIRLLQDLTDASDATIGNNKSIIFDNNGMTLTKTTAAITINDGSTLEVAGNGTITTANNILIFRNSGILNITHTGTISDTYTGNNRPIYNSGVLNKTGTGTITSSTNWSTIGNIGSGAVATISNGTVSSTGNAQALHTYGGGILNIEGNTTSILALNNNAIVVGHFDDLTSGTLNVKEGNIISQVASGIVSDVCDGAVINVSGGTVTGVRGIKLQGNAVLTLGDSSNALSTTSPKIQGTSEYSVHIIGSNNTFNYYDGVLIGALHNKTYDGREVTFSTSSETTINPLTGHKPYTRQNTTTNLYETVLEKEIIVTFNPNPTGVTGATVNPTTKTVLTNTPYGELPVAQRTGYTCIGWNGKNLYDFGSADDYTTVGNMNIDLNEKSISITKTNSWAGHYWRNETNKYNPGTYTLSATFSGDTDPRHIIFAYDENGNLMDNTNLSISGLTWNNYYNGWFSTSTAGSTKTVTIPSSVAYWKYGSSFTGASGTVGTISNIQIEQGSTATAYEPYNITADTIVVRDQDHTLNAIWEPNKYHVFYNGNGATNQNNNGLIGKYDGVYNAASNTHDGTATTWVDMNRTRTPGTITNATWGDDCLQFNGTNSWVNLGQMNSDYQTIEVTFSSEDTSDNDKCIIGNWEIAGGGILLRSRKIYGEFYLVDSNGNNGGWKTIDSGVTVQEGKKYHVALTYDGSKVKLYVNGQEKGNAISFTGKIKPGENTAMVMGVNPRQSSSINSYFKGKIYNAAVYNRALSAEEITQDGGKIVTFDSTYGELPTPTRAGYEFAGWYNAPTGGTEITSSTIFQTPDDVMIYARWTPKTYHVNYIGNGATNLNTTGLMGKYDALYNTVSNTHNSSATTLVEMSRTRNPGVIEDATWGDDYLQFNGTSSWVDLGVMNSDYQTLEATFSVDEFPSSGEIGTVIANKDNGGGAIDVVGGNYVRGYFWINGDYRPLSYKIEKNKVYHVAVTYDGQQEVLYVNGKQVAINNSSTITNNVITPSVTNTVMALGCNTTVSGAEMEFFNGKIYNAAVYSRALTAAEVAQDGGIDVEFDSTYGELPTSSKVNYTLDGWYTAPTGGTKVTSSIQMQNPNDHVIYAKWEPNHYKLTVNPTGGTYINGTETVIMDPDLIYYTNNWDHISIPSKTGYTFDGWYTSETGGTQVYDNTGYAIVDTVYFDHYRYYIGTSDLTVYAHWTPNTYKVKFNKNSNAATGTMADQNFTYDVAQNLTANGFTRNGYTFAGWSKNADGTGTVYEDEQSVKNLTATKGETVNLYALWNEKTYTLTVKPNGGTYNSKTTDTTYTLKYSDVQNIPNPTRTDYTFKGWNELSGASFTNGLTSVSKYCNQNGGQVTISTRNKSADNPLSGMTSELAVISAGGAATKPGLGGFVHSKTPANSKVYVHVFVAKLPEGYYFHNANNSLGTGGTTKWLTSNAGTGSWQTYAYQVNTGTGTLGTFGHVYMSKSITNVWGGPTEETGAVTAYLAYSNIYDITSDNTGIGQYDGTGVLTAKWALNNYQNKTTSKYYEKLSDALSEVESNQTIEVLRSTTETTAPELAAGKTGVKLNLAGKIVTLDGVALTNKGTLDIYTAGDLAILEGSATNVIVNDGTLTTNGTSSAKILTISSTSSSSSARVLTNNAGKTATLNENAYFRHETGTTDTRYVVENNGNLTVAGAYVTVDSVSTSTWWDRGIINNAADARTMITSGRISTPGIAVINAAGTGTTTPAISISSNAQVNSSESYAVCNSANATGKIKIEGGILTSDTYNTISNNGAGEIEITGGYIWNDASGDNMYVVRNISTGKITISGGNIYNRGTSTTAYVVANTAGGTIDISGNPSISSSTTNAVRNFAGGTINISGGTIKSTTTATYSAIVNSVGGTINISGGTISSDGAQGVVNSTTGKINVSGSSTSITGKNGLYNSAGGTLTVTGGTITGTAGDGVHGNTGTVTIGTNESTPNVSVTAPSITGSAYGVQTTGTFNFYDGILKGATGKSISKQPTAKPTGYVAVTSAVSTTQDKTVLGPGAPTVTAKLENASGAAYTSGTWTNKSVYVALTDTNVGKGIKQYEYRSGTTGDWTVKTASSNTVSITFNVERNQETIYFRALDNNNVYSAESSIVLAIDKTVPTLSGRVAANIDSSNKLTFSLSISSASDATSKIKGYRVYNGTTALGTLKATTATTGTISGMEVSSNTDWYTKDLVVKAVDNAGNVSTGVGVTTYTVGTLDGLKGLATCVNAGGNFQGRSVQQTANIASTGTWTPIGNTTSKPFKGNYNGQNKTITGIANNTNEQYRALFGNIEGPSSSSKITIQNVDVTVNFAANTGLDFSSKASPRIAGLTCRSENANITNCTVRGTINNSIMLSSDNYAHIAGIVGNAADNTTISDCHNYATINGYVEAAYKSMQARVAGIAGTMAETTIIQNCENHGAITGKYLTAGIVGYGVGTVKNCTNSGAISNNAKKIGTDTEDKNIDSIGGIVAKNQSTGTIDSCTNSATITANAKNEEGNAGVGGICGRNYGETIKSCINNGDVSTTNGGLAGGIAGVNASGSITGSNNNGIVLYNSNNSNENANIGGIAGKNYGGTLTNCNSVGKISTSNWNGSHVGGITGNNSAYCLADDADYNWIGADKDATIQGCKILDSTKLVIYGENYVGGIAGENFKGNSSKNAIIKSSTIAGNESTIGITDYLTGVDYVGGIAGKNDGTINTNCSSKDVNVFGANKVGGIVGENNGTISSCYTNVFVETSGDYTDTITGKVVSAVKHFGGIAGYNTKTIETCTAENHEIGTVNYQYVGGITGYNTSTGTITSCKVVDANIKGADNIGGIAADNRGTIQKCGVAGGNIAKNSSSTGNNNYIGGIAGYNAKTISECYNLAAVGNSSSKIIGGIVGRQNNGTIQYCYNRGAVTGSADAGGITGNNPSGSTIKYSYSTNYATAGSKYYWISSSGGGTFTDVRYLSGSVANGYACGTATTAANLKALYGQTTWSTYFKQDTGNTNAGYPLLKNAKY